MCQSAGILYHRGGAFHQAITLFTPKYPAGPWNLYQTMDLMNWWIQSTLVTILTRLTSSPNQNPSLKVYLTSHLISPYTTPTNMIQYHKLSVTATQNTNLLVFAPGLLCKASVHTQSYLTPQ